MELNRDPIKLWGRATSINVQKVLWVIAELDIGCDRIDAGGKFGGLDDPEYVAMNPNRRVPTLRDGNLVLWESNAICRYLVESYGSEQPFGGNSVKDRATADMWMEWFQSSVYAHFIALFYQTVRLAPSQRNPLKKQSAIDALLGPFEMLNEILGNHKFMLGDDLSLADIPTGSCLYRYFTIEIDRPDLPNIDRYYSDLTSRQSYRDAVMVDYSSLRGSD